MLSRTRGRVEGGVGFEVRLEEGLEINHIWGQIGFELKISGILLQIYLGS